MKKPWKEGREESAPRGSYGRTRAAHGAGGGGGGAPTGPACCWGARRERVLLVREEGGAACDPRSCDLVAAAARTRGGGRAGAKVQGQAVPRQAPPGRGGGEAGRLPSTRARRPWAPTCRELRMANAYWKATAWLLTASTPKTQEVPRMGSSTATALAVNLAERGWRLGWRAGPGEGTGPGAAPPWAPWPGAGRRDGDAGPTGWLRAQSPRSQSSAGHPAPTQGPVGRGSQAPTEDTGRGRGGGRAGTQSPAGRLVASLGKVAPWKGEPGPQAHSRAGAESWDRRRCARALAPAGGPAASQGGPAYVLATEGHGRDP